MTRIAMGLSPVFLQEKRFDSHQLSICSGFMSTAVAKTKLTTMFLVEGVCSFLACTPWPQLVSYALDLASHHTTDIQYCTQETAKHA